MCFVGLKFLKLKIHQAQKVFVHFQIPSVDFKLCFEIDIFRLIFKPL